MGTNATLRVFQHRISTIHYENTPMQYTAIFHGYKNDNFHMKNCIIFLIFARNIDRGYTLEPLQWGGSNEYPRSMFKSKNKKTMYTPVHPAFTIYKWGVFFNVIVAITFKKKQSADRIFVFLSADKHQICRPTKAITLKTNLTDYLKKSQNFTIGRSSADYL